jgi:hypothetical protein
MGKEIFTPKKPLRTAVLFLVFNRIDSTKRVFQAIRKAQPPILYIASDGARENIYGEEEKVQDVRNYVLKNIDWDCRVVTLFREKNLGCKIAVSSAITWFFENEERGIILEDDCLPSQSFFWFCEELLERYKDDMRVGLISGDNFQSGIERGDADYYFSIYGHIWGWASWANRWKKYDVELDSFNDHHFIEDTFKSKKTKKYWINIFKKMKNKEIDTWDYQWTFTLWREKQLSILPNKNLISNIGFGEDATHTVNDSSLSNIKSYEIVLQKHPIDIRQDIEADEYDDKYVFVKRSIIQRIKNKIFNIVKQKRGHYEEIN